MQSRQSELPRVEKKRGRGRPRIYTSEQERRNEEYRQRRVRKDDLLGFFEALTQAFERAGCHPIFDHLPDGPGARIREAVRRLDAVKLVAFQREEDVIEQLSLPGMPTSSPPFEAESETSRQAAEALPEPIRRQQQADLLSHYAAAGDEGLIDQDSERLTGWSGDTVRPRKRDLKQRSAIVKAHRTRLTASGRRAQVWVITQTGRELLAQWRYGP